ncbi:MAG: UDP-N-acetylmuramate dehydrogenase [Prevotella sp.]|nr:UDP-N-acetylmuramate dehydrogenase [Prevotella sp.]
MKDLKHYSLLPHNTFGIQADCDRFIDMETEDDVMKLKDMLDDKDMPLLIIGRGSNLLLTDDYHATVLHCSIKGKTIVKEDRNSVLLRCGAGEEWDSIVDYCVAHDWQGIENLSLIPGEVGASAVQNIGAYGTEVKEIIHSIEAVEISTGKKHTFTNEQCEYSYRQSKFKNEWKDRFIITHVTYRLEKSTDYIPKVDYGNIKSELERKGISLPTMKDIRDVVISIRKDKLPDPEVEGNAGSFFMNPIVEKATFMNLLEQYPDMPHYNVDSEREKIPAGWMIDQCGWKGKTLGKAGVHDRQALVLVNRGGATGKDILHLCNTIRNDVRQKFGIDIHPEVNIR